ncbi:hypothetical protein ACFC0M_16635 [Streptomyces sp. NPDC056149]|uniref:hypothetical protein n=1 Tax=unclassified Streptomyces TaxID=2593676 RepID=UPI0023810532|nr:hypothetical protein [Streptomyces sp. WZ-12]
MSEKSRLPPVLQSFVDELALCVATYGDKGAALLWTEADEHLLLLYHVWLLDRLSWMSGIPGPGVPVSGVPASGAPVAAGPEAAPLVAALGRNLGCSVRAYYHVLPAGGGSDRVGFGEDEVTLSVAEGACRLRLWSLTGAECAAPDLRLREGESLYVPAGHVYEVSDVHTPTVLVVLVLGEED